MSLSANDRADIVELSTRYCHAADYGEWDELLRLFAPDAHFESLLSSWSVHRDIQPNLYLRLVGAAQIRAFFTAGGNRQPVEGDKVVMLHVPSAHSIVQATGQSATTNCYFTFYHLEGPPRMTAYGRYVDRFSKIAGKWKIAHRSVVIEWDDRDGAGAEQSKAGSICHATPSRAHPWPASGPVTSLAAVDRQAILETLDRYPHLVEYRDWDGLLGLFTDDAHFDGPLKSWAVHRERFPTMRLRLVGHAQIRQFFENAGRTVTPPGEPEGERQVEVLHEPTAHTIQGDGESARMTSYFTFHYLEDPVRMTAYGQYRDRLVKVDGTWKFAHRFVDIEWEGR